MCNLSVSFKKATIIIITVEVKKTKPIVSTTKKIGTIIKWMTYITKIPIIDFNNVLIQLCTIHTPLSNSYEQGKYLLLLDMVKINMTLYYK